MHSTQHQLRRAFTLVELLFVMLILSVLVAMAFSALAGAAEQARVARTKTVIAKLDQLITEKYEIYRTRSVRFNASSIPANDPQRSIKIARLRLNSIRELMRMEMPDRMTDVQNSPVVLLARPALNESYKRRAGMTSWSTSYQGAECLYLIVTSMREGDSSVLEFFSPSEIGDVDDDQMPEFLDAWGTPIEFLRWPAGYLADDPENIGSVTNPVATFQIANRKLAPDPFDPIKADGRWSNASALTPYLIKPLIFSAGRDKLYDINQSSVVYSTTTPPNDPYNQGSGSDPLAGAPLDTDGDGSLSFGDNITNHYQEAQ